MERKRTVRTTVIKTQTLVGTELRPNSKRKAAANRVVLNNESTYKLNNCKQISMCGFDRRGRSELECRHEMR